MAQVKSVQTKWPLDLGLPYLPTRPRPTYLNGKIGQLEFCLDRARSRITKSREAYRNNFPQNKNAKQKPAVKNRLSKFI